MDWFIANIEHITTAVIGINVFLCARNNIWNWPIGLVGVTMYGLSAWFLWGLYADALLQIVYFFTGIIGWWYWAKGGAKRTPAPITDLHSTEWCMIIIAIIAGTSFIGIKLEGTDSAVPFLDAFTTVVCVIAQALLILRKRSAWILWVIADFVYVYMFYVKGLNSFAVLYAAFTLNAAYGYYTWTKVKKSQCSTPISSAA